MSTPEEDQTKVWSADAPEAPAGEPDVPAAADAEPVAPADAPEPEPIPHADPPDAADEGSVDANAAAAFAAAGAAPPPGALTERPEVLVGAAFAGGVVFAMLLKRLAR